MDSLGRHVGQNIKNWGLECYRRNCVSIVYVDSEFVSAEVRGSRTYDVDLELADTSLIYSCSCPFFEDKFSVCKHIWATLLEMEQQGLLQGWVRDAPKDLIPAYLDPFEEPDQDYQPGPDAPSGAGRSDPLDRHGQGGRNGYDSAGGDWRHLLQKMSRRRRPVPARPICPPGSEILYILEFSGSVPSFDAAIRLNIRELKKNGGWKKAKLFAFTHDLLEWLPDPADKDLLYRLAGVQRETWYRSPYESTARFIPKARDLKALLPDISATGRFYFRDPETNEIIPVQWDGAAPWAFEIDVLPDRAGKQYKASGTFHRDGQRISVSLPDNISKEGIFILDNTVSFFEGPADWVALFRDEGSFLFSETEAGQWLEAMHALPSIPSIRLPEDLRITEIDVDPQPVLQISTRHRPWGAPDIMGDLFFRYRDRTVGASEPGTGFMLPGGRCRVLRHPGKEARAMETLENTGFKRWKDGRNGRSWTIVQTQLFTALEELVSSGWRVEADGRPFRTPGAFRMRLASGIDWFELHGDVEYEGTSVPIPRLLDAMKRHESSVVLDDGSYGMLPKDWIDRYGMLLEMGRAQKDHVRFGRNQAGLLDTLLEAEPHLCCDDAFARLRQTLRSFAGVDPADPPEGFRGALRQYQRIGLGWMHFLERFGFGGCLADDMGLGKTIQVLALLEERRRLRAGGSSPDPMPPSLVVMPKSLVFNWIAEAGRFTPGIRILDHTGGERIRGHEHFDEYDVVFTTYGTLRRDAPFFKEKTFDYIILDEAQAIKNAATESSKAARLLKGRHRLALSGTPIENRIEELWSLFEFLNPGMLGSVSAFRSRKGPQEKHGDGQWELLSKALRPFVLRRTKKQVAPDLPEKVEQTLYCRLEPNQRALYDELREHYRKSLLQRVEQVGMNNSKIYVLEALLRLRQAAIHPGLINPSRVRESSAKLDMLVPQLLEILEEGHKALVFSQFTSMLEILRARLREDNIGYEYLDGRTRDRSACVDRFQNDPEAKLFLISLKAGGLGLNLTAAEYVFLLDPWWNPAVEAQAVDRTHRIGQTRSVFAYRLIAKDTVEEKVLALQETKREIADAIITQDNSLIGGLSTDDLALLLS